MVRAPKSLWTLKSMGSTCLFYESVPFDDPHRGESIGFVVVVVIKVRII